MTYQEKFRALKCLGEASICMRNDLSWYVYVSGVSRKEGCMLAGGVNGEADPVKAIEQYWNWATDPKFYLVTSRAGVRESLRWSAFMWERVTEDNA